MKSRVATVAVLVLSLASCGVQINENFVANHPDEAAWKLFLQVNADAGGGAAQFETWASDTDTFKLDPKFPNGASASKLTPPRLFKDVCSPGAAGLVNPHQMINKPQKTAMDALQPLPPCPSKFGEEVRRNRPDFDYIVAERLFLVSGLQAHFGKNISFPPDSIEIKAEWVEVGALDGIAIHPASAADAAKRYHVRTAEGTQWALVAMHVSSKLVPNWTWATFEHVDNAGRCDDLGCLDQFGAEKHFEAANEKLDQGYPPCVKTTSLKQMFATAKVSPAFENYCLNGSQVDFEDPTGNATRLGNSLIEHDKRHSSCLTCHGAAGWDANGKDGLDATIETNRPTGPVPSAWFWTAASGATPPALFRTQGDFVWSIPVCVVDDTKTPPAIKDSCVGR